MCFEFLYRRWCWPQREEGQDLCGYSRVARRCETQHWGHSPKLHSFTVLCLLPLRQRQDIQAPRDCRPRRSPVRCAVIDADVAVQLLSVDPVIGSHLVHKPLIRTHYTYIRHRLDVLRRKQKDANVYRFLCRACGETTVLFSSNGIRNHLGSRYVK